MATKTPRVFQDVTFIVPPEKISAGFEQPGRSSDPSVIRPRAARRPEIPCPGRNYRRARNRWLESSIAKKWLSHYRSLDNQIQGGCPRAARIVPSGEQDMIGSDRRGL